MNKRKTKTLPQKADISSEQLRLSPARDGISGITAVSHGFYRTNWAALPEHSHDSIELCFCSRGSLVFECEGLTHTLLPNNVFLTQPGDRHHLVTNHKGMRMYWLFFRYPAKGRTVLGLSAAETAALVKRLRAIDAHVFAVGPSMRQLFRDVFRAYEEIAKGPYRAIVLRTLFLKILLEVIDSGTHKYSVGNNMRGRCVSWGLFKVRATGKVFGFTSTHLDGFDSPDTDIQIAEWAEIVHKLAESGPVMATGDFNTAESMNDFNDIQTSSGMRDLRYDCEVRLNEEGSYHDLGNPMSGYGLALDHIFATQNAIGKRFEMLIFNEQIWGSDHSWVLCDVALN